MATLATLPIKLQLGRAYDTGIQVSFSYSGSIDVPVMHEVPEIIYCNSLRINSSDFFKEKEKEEENQH